MTGEEDVQIFKEAFTYINIVESPLRAIMMEGFSSKVSRGWEEEIMLLPADLSYDPDEPEDKVLIFAVKSFLTFVVIIIFFLAESKLHMVLSINISSIRGI